MNSTKLAKIISFVLGPQVWLPVFFTIFIFKTGLTNQQIKILFPSILILEVIIPLLMILIFIRLKIVSDWDITKKEERQPVMMAVVILSLISLMTIYLFGNELILSLTLILFLIIIITSAITFFWKISLHMTLNVTGTIIINFLFSWSLPWLYLTIPLVFWARLKLKKHTVNQLLAALFLDCFIILVSFYFLRYIKF